MTHRYGLTLATYVFLCGASLAQVTELQFSVYMTATSVDNFFADVESDDDPIEMLQRMQIEKVYMEVYRGGRIVAASTLERVRDYLEEHGVAVAGGIATVPGGDFGVRQVGPLGWFNWQNEKTQNDLREVVRMAAGVFDEFIVDDFFCTGDVSEESALAKGDRSWSEYRRELLAELTQSVFIQPAREVNPGIRMIVKYPQWYDRFHLFGYDVPRQSAQFDATWVGTETRGARTQRFGFTQPYEGFVNYRWIASIAGDKTAGAWFDHGDCDANDFIEQAYQTVLAGAPEIILFNYNNLRQGHPGHELLIQETDRLRKLSAYVREHPVQGIPAYKPPNTDAGGDLYIMDFLGMLGIPLVPVSTFPEDAPVIFLPTQAAGDKGIKKSTDAAVKRGARMVVTTGFAMRVENDFRESSGPLRAESVRVGSESASVKHGLLLASDVSPEGWNVLLSAEAEGESRFVLAHRRRREVDTFILNTHTYSQADFDAVGEVLLSPRPLGLLELPREYVNELRRPFLEPLGITFDAPSRVCLQPMGTSSWVIHNYNDESVTFTLHVDAGFQGTLVNGLTSETIEHKSNSVGYTVPPRSRVWLLSTK